MTTWTPEQAETLRELWAQGKSAAIIGNLMGVTRNAVIGKVDRLGLPKRKMTMQARSQRAKRAYKPKAPRVLTPILKPLPSVAPEEPPPRPVVLLTDLELHHCRWPIGEPDEPQFGFCGSSISHSDSSYCPYHRWMSFRK